MDHHLLIRTKLFIPPLRAETVPRPRLIERLNGGLDKKLIFISASAGFGKSTLLSQWIRRRGIPAAWYSIDEEDNDQTRFMVYLISALQSLFPGIGSSALAVQQSPQTMPMEPDMTGLINEISLLPDDFVLVLDDYHLIKSETIHKALAFFIEHLPSQLHLVIATRSDPPLPLALLLARGEMIELRSNDLRFTPDEVRAFLYQAMKNDLSDSEIHTLSTRTEGWIAGLRLAAISLQGRSSDTIDRFIKEFAGSNRYILDYLMEEVLQQQSPTAQEFLLKTSILKRLNAPLCDALTEQGNSQCMLEKIERANLFVEPLDDRRTWYRYHNLFADLLRLRLQQIQPNLLPVLHRRASTWYENNGLISAAIYHSLASGDFEHAAVMIEQVSTDILVHGEVTTLITWLNALPADIAHARPELDMIKIWIHIVDGQLQNIRQDIDRIENNIHLLGQSIDAERRQNLNTQIIACHIYMALHNGEFLRALEMKRKMLDPQNIENSIISAFKELFSAFEVLLEQNPDEFILPSENSRLQEFKSANNLIFLLTIHMAAYFQTLNGSLRKAIKLYEYGLLAAEQAVQKNRDISPGGHNITPAIGLMYQGLGDIMRRQNKLDKAQEYLDLCLKYGKQWSNAEILFDNYIACANLQLSRGEIEAAEVSFSSIKELSRKQSLSPTSIRQWKANRAHLWLKQGRLHLVRRWSETLQEFDPDMYGNPHIAMMLYGIEQVVLAHYLIASGQYDRAVKQLKYIQQSIKPGESTFPIVEFKIIQALAYERNGERHNALTCLQQIMEKARSETYLRAFLDEGQPMALLLAAYRQQLSGDDALRPFVKELLAAFEKEARSQPTVNEQQPAVPANGSGEEALSQRELEVLGLISAGLSNKEIALEMNIALSTVKTHIHSLYRKLGISKRTQAVTKARQL